VSLDKQWIVTADQGKDSMIIFWDSQTGAPVKSIFQPHPFGVEDMDLSSDGSFLVTLSKVDPHSPDQPQVVSVWDWTSGREGAALTEVVKQTQIGKTTFQRDQQQQDQVASYQTSIQFHPSSLQHFVTNGARSIIFWFIEDNSLHQIPPITK
jgi:WD40 repeat protein